MDWHNYKLESMALFSRIITLILQYISNSVLPDHKADAFRYPKSLDEETAEDETVKNLFGGLVRWDAQYFMHIARYGYTYENTLAFFPLYPLSVRAISNSVYHIFPLGKLETTLLLVFVIVNAITFTVAVKLLCKLTTILFNEKIADNVAFLFCFNPASIFFAAPYTECLFCCLTFWSILNCISLYNKFSSVACKIHYSDVIYLLPIMLCTLVRSNGILNIGFFTYTCICLYYKRHANSSAKVRLERFVKYVIVNVSLSLVLIAPFVVFQIYCYTRFCTNFDIKLPVNIVDHALLHNFILPGQFSKHNQTWCYNYLPLAYSYVQNHYWNVGFLRYYELKQIPNFFLAAPTLGTVISYCLKHVKLNYNNKIKDLFSFDKLSKKACLRDPFYGPHLNVFVIHALFLSLFCLFFMHVQVATRFLCSATPLFYWACASYSERNERGQYTNNYFVRCFYFSYFVVGTFCFSNFLPWT